mgnify:CR=1 FL=1
MPEFFHILRPAALLLVPVVVATWWLWQRRTDPLRGWRAQVDPGLLAALADQPRGAARRPWPVLVAWLLAVVALAGPSWQPEPSPFAEDTTPLMILLKADTSMDTPDPEPSRIERAQLKIRDLAEARDGQPLGLIAYAGSAHLVLPPTKDTAAVATMAAEISPEIMPEAGDRLDLAIARAAEVSRQADATLLVVTDTAGGATQTLADARRKAGSPLIQLLAITPPESPTDSLVPVAKALDADIVPMSIDDSDITRIVRKARRPPVARAADGSEIWRDGGYYLVPALALLALLPFRRQSPAPEAKP